MAAQETVSTVPSSWPGAWGIYTHSKAIVMANVWTVLGLTVLSILISGVANVDKHHQASPWTLIAWLLSVWVTLALMVAFLAGAKGKQIDAWEALKQGGAAFWNGLLTVIMVALLCIASLVLFIIPFFFVAPRLVLALYYVLDKRQDPVAAIKSSWHATNGHVGKVYGIVGVTILFALLCLVLIGFYFIFIYQAAIAVLYLYISRHKGADVPAASE
jgi:hypothetical protein